MNWEFVIIIIIIVGTFGDSLKEFDQSNSNKIGAVCIWAGFGCLDFWEEVETWAGNSLSLSSSSFASNTPSDSDMGGHEASELDPCRLR